MVIKFTEKSKLPDTWGRAKRWGSTVKLVQAIFSACTFRFESSRQILREFCAVLWFVLTDSRSDYVREHSLNYVGST